MCARLTMAATQLELESLFGLAFEMGRLRPRYNVAPSQPVPVVRASARGGREVVAMRWGLIPHWNADPKHPGFVNARAETAADKPTFRDPIRRRRGLMPADGFYEWEAVGRGKKQPWYFRKAGGGPLALAAVWDTWNGPDGPVDTVAVLTTEANDLVRPLHERMPVILPPVAFDAWLDPRETRPDRLLPLLRPYPAELMEAWPVAPKVNAATVDEPGMNERVAVAVRAATPSLF